MFSVEELTAHTRDTYNLRQVWYALTGHRSLTFKVKASENAIVNLASIPTLHNVLAYEITIGKENNKKTTIWRRNGTSVSEDTNGILDPEFGSEFWIAWGDAAVRLGKGRTVGENEVIVYHDEDLLEINAASITTSQGVEGEWEIYKSGGGYIMRLMLHSVLNSIQDHPFLREINA